MSIIPLFVTNVLGNVNSTGNIVTLQLTYLVMNIIVDWSVARSIIVIRT